MNATPRFPHRQPRQFPVVPTLVLTLGLFLAAFIGQAGGQEVDDGKVIRDRVRQIGDQVELRWADYEAKLNAILKTRRVEEQAFVNLVLEYVRAGKIPVPMLESSFLWVLSKRPGTKYPFIYFERVLRQQGALAGIDIPPFDYAIYSDSRYRSNMISRPLGISGSHGFSSNRR